MSRLNIYRFSVAENIILVTIAISWAILNKKKPSFNIFTAAAGSAEVVIILKSCLFVAGGQGLDTFIRAVLLAF